MTRRAPAVRVVSVTARTVRRRDAILIGGQLRRITGVNLVHGGARLALDTGERLTIARNREYTVARPVPAGERAPDGPDSPDSPDGEGLSAFCTAALAGGPKWTMLHAHCRGPMVLTAPSGDQVLFPCGCLCHLGGTPGAAPA